MLLREKNLLTQEHRNLFFLCPTSAYVQASAHSSVEGNATQGSKKVPRQKDSVRRVEAIPQDIGLKLLRVTFCLTTRHGN